MQQPRKKDIMLGTMPGTRRQGCQSRQWLDNITQWSERGLVDIVRLAEERNGYRRFVFVAGSANSDIFYTPTIGAGPSAQQTL